MSVELQKLIRKNTLTNYLTVGVRLVEGILVTRWMYLYLGKEFYGFWALLWEIFFYVLVLNFGFGKAAQRCTAENLFETDIKEYNRTVSTVFTLLTLMSLVIVGLTFAATLFLPALTNLEDPETIAYCRKCMIIFGLGIGITFPTGIFPEILIGLKALYLRNYALVTGRILEMAGIFAIFTFFKGSLLSLVWFTVLLNLSLNFWMFAAIRKKIPGFRLRFHLHWSDLKKLVDFSLFSYLYSIFNLLIVRADRLILSGVMGLAQVGIFQLGTRIPEMARSMTTQYQDNVAPLTAELCKKDDIPLLRRIIIDGLRLTAWLVAGGIVVVYMTTPEIYFFLFKENNQEVLLVCRIMLISEAIMVMFRSFGNHIMMMSGRHRLICGIAAAELLVKLPLSIYLVHQIGLLGVVWGTLIPNVIISLCVMLPFTARFIDYSVLRLLKDICLFPLLDATLAASSIWLFDAFILKPFLPELAVFFRLCLLGAVGGIVYLSFGWFDFVDEKKRRQIIRGALFFIRNREEEELIVRPGAEPIDPSVKDPRL